MEGDKQDSPSTSRSQILEDKIPTSRQNVPNRQNILSDKTDRPTGRPIPDMSKTDEGQRHEYMDQDKENQETWAPKKRKTNRTRQDKTREDKKPRVLFQEDKTGKESDQVKKEAATRMEMIRQQFKLRLVIPKTEKVDQTEEYVEEEEDKKPSLANDTTEEYIDEMLKSSDEDSEDKKTETKHQEQEKKEDDGPNEKIRMETVEKLLNMTEHAYMWLGVNVEEEVPNYWAKRS